MDDIDEAAPLPSGGILVVTARIICCRQRGKQASKTPDKWLGGQKVFLFYPAAVTSA
jgi:hypothetical protein